ncbi:MAG: hypothetical protein ACFFC7_06380 [Candidatus Hermodarchaeota archaeon]
MKIRFLVYGIILCIICLGSILICLGLTGRSLPPYSVLNPSDSINIGTETLSVEEIVQEYAPIVYQASNFSAGTPQKMFYELQVNDSEIIILYRSFWADENHPIVGLDILYDIFRELYYGSIADIEPIQLRLNTSTGEVKEIYFQMDPTHNYAAFVPQHNSVILRLVAHNNYSMTVQRELKGFVSPFWQEKRILLKVETWNHLFNLYNNESLEKYESLALEPYTEELYWQFKSIRRIAGPVFTAPSDAPQILLLLILVVIVEISTFLKIVLRDSKQIRRIEE